MGKPLILTFVSHYLPGYKAGGPIQTIANMVEQLSDAFEFRIVTADRDLGDASAFSDLASDIWTDCGRASVFYRSPGVVGWRRLLGNREARTPDLIYLNSFFSVHGSLCPLILCRLGQLGRAPVLLAPRGEFSPGALGLKRVKKRAFISLSRLLQLHKGVTFQASSDREAAQIRRVLGPVKVVVAMDLSGQSKQQIAPRALAQLPHPLPLRVVFLSRISPMKNLVGALEILGRLDSAAVEFDIYGVVEDAAYWTACKVVMARLPAHVQVHYKGPVRPDQVEAILGDYDLFLLPTLGENFGHVIREALSAGVPVLISDQTPWRDLVAKGAGADLPLDALDAFADWITDFAQASSAEREAMRTAARSLGDDARAAEASRQANYKMLFAALQQTA